MAGSALHVILLSLDFKGSEGPPGFSPQDANPLGSQLYAPASPALPVTPAKAVPLQRSRGSFTDTQTHTLSSLGNSQPEKESLEQGGALKVTHQVKETSELPEALKGDQRDSSHFGGILQPGQPRLRVIRLLGVACSLASDVSPHENRGLASAASSLKMSFPDLALPALHFPPLCADPPHCFPSFIHL